MHIENLAVYRIRFFGLRKCKAENDFSHRINITSRSLSEKECNEKPCKMIAIGVVTLKP